MDDAELEQLLRAARTEHFGAGFSSRVLRRTEMLGNRALGAVLQRYCYWMVPAAVTAIAVLAIHNARASGDAHKGLDGLLSLQTVSLDAAYAFDAGAPQP